MILPKKTDQQPNCLLQCFTLGYENRWSLNSICQESYQQRSLQITTLNFQIFSCIRENGVPPPDLNPLTGDQTYLYDLIYGNWMHGQISTGFQQDFE